jgi:Transposase DDE domain
MTMSSVPQVASAIQRVLTTRAKELERASGFVTRSTAQLDGPSFAQTTVLCWMNEPQASYSQLQQVASSLGVQVSNQAIEQRFGKPSAAFMRQVLEEAVGQVISSEAAASELLGRFNGVYLQDGTVISLPAALAQSWPGCGGSTPEAGTSSVRAQVRLEVTQGQMQGPWLQPGRAAERSGEAYEAPLPAGCLYNVDMGYFTLTDMRRHGKEGHFWLTQAKASVKLYDQRGQCWDLLDLLEAQHSDTIDLEVQVGVKERLPARLIAVRLSQEQVTERRKRANKQHEGPPKGCQPPGKRRSTTGKRQRWRKNRRVSPARERLMEWTVLLTTVPVERLSVEEALVLARCRWQIELLWKLWKQHGKLDTWRSMKPYRVLTEIFAKLLGLVITHWLTLLGCWQAPNRSLVKAKQVVQWMAPGLALALAGDVPMERVVERTAATMGGCTLNSRRKQPNCSQLLDNPKLIRGLG